MLVTLAGKPLVKGWTLCPVFAPEYLGQMPYVSLNLFQKARATRVILAMLLLVLAVDALSAWTRQRWGRA